MPVFSALANDEGYENVFAGQLESFARSGDVVIAISASGKSPNVIKAVELARRMGARTVGLTGFDGGLLAGMVDHNIHVPSHCIEFVEDVHLMLEHLITKALRQQTLALYLRRFRSWRQDWRVLITSPELLERLLVISRDRVGATSGSIMLLGDNGGVDHMALAYAGDVHTLSEAHHIEILRYGLAGWVVENRRAALIHSTQDDPRWRLMAWEIDGAGSPLSDQRTAGRPGARHGCIDLAHPEPGKFTGQESDSVAAICSNGFPAPLAGQVSRFGIMLLAHRTASRTLRKPSALWVSPGILASAPRPVRTRTVWRRPAACPASMSLRASPMR